MTIRTRMFLGYTCMFVLMTVVVLTVLYTVSGFRDDFYDVVNDSYEKTRRSQEIRYRITEISRGLIQVVLNGEHQDFQDELHTIGGLWASTQGALEELRHLTDQPARMEIVDDLARLLGAYRSVYDRVLHMLSLHDYDEAARFLIDDGLPTREMVYDTVNELIRLQELDMNEALWGTEELYNQSRMALLVLLAIMGSTSVGVSMWVTGSITRTLRTVAQVVRGIPDDATDELPRITDIPNDEIADISHAFNQMATSLEKKASDEQAYIAAIEEQTWVNEHIADLAMAFQGFTDRQPLGEALIGKLAPTVGAAYGAFYLYDQTEQSLQCLAAYAPEDTEITQEIRIGQGLVGQCAADRQMIQLNTVPDGYVQVNSGLGHAPPRHLLVVPIVAEEITLGVIELASFSSLAPKHLRLIKELAADLGLTINRIYAHERVTQLLNESQTLTEELQSQSEELQTQQEELRSTNEKLEEQYQDSERRALELRTIQGELGQKAKELALSSRYKSQFLANMSHELRTPLNSLLILARMLADNAEKNLSPNQVEYAQTIHSAGADLLNLINDILELAKVEAGEMTITTQEINVVHMTSALSKQFQPLASRKGLRFDTVIPDPITTPLVTDESRLKQILRNLLSNAFKFTEAGHVTLRVVPSQTDEATPSWTFSVEDTGIGIPHDQLQVIFEAFRQADGSTNRSYSGTGLGLAISREIAEALGGSISVVSEVNQGTSFTLTIPNLPQHTTEEAAISQEVSTQIPGAASTNRESKHPTVLIVDDDMRNVFALSSALETHGFHIVFAENGHECLDMLAAGQPVDIILMDIMMPDMDGYEAMTAIRQQPQFSSLPIIALTAKAMRGDRDKCMQAGASDYVSKPVQIKQLISLIDMWLSGEGV